MGFQTDLHLRWVLVTTSANSIQRRMVCQCHVHARWKQETNQEKGAVTYLLLPNHPTGSLPSAGYFHAGIGRVVDSNPTKRAHIGTAVDIALMKFM